MAKAMTAASEVCPSEEKEDKLAVGSEHRNDTNLPMQVVKNLVFWGSIPLGMYAFYTLVAAL